MNTKVSLEHLQEEVEPAVTTLQTFVKGTHVGRGVNNKEVLEKHMNILAAMQPAIISILNNYSAGGIVEIESKTLCKEIKEVISDASMRLRMDKEKRVSKDFEDRASEILKEVKARLLLLAQHNVASTPVSEELLITPSEMEQEGKKLRLIAHEEFIMLAQDIISGKLFPEQYARLHYSTILAMEKLYVSTQRAIKKLVEKVEDPISVEVALNLLSDILLEILVKDEFALQNTGSLDQIFIERIKGAYLEQVLYEPLSVEEKVVSFDDVKQLLLQERRLASTSFPVSDMEKEAIKKEIEKTANDYTVSFSINEAFHGREAIRTSAFIKEFRKQHKVEMEQYEAEVAALAKEEAKAQEIAKITLMSTPTLSIEPTPKVQDMKTHTLQEPFPTKEISEKLDKPTVIPVVVENVHEIVEIPVHEKAPETKQGSATPVKVCRPRFEAAGVLQTNASVVSIGGTSVSLADSFYASSMMPEKEERVKEVIVEVIKEVTVEVEKVVMGEAPQGKEMQFHHEVLDFLFQNVIAEIKNMRAKVKENDFLSSLAIFQEELEKKELDVLVNEMKEMNMMYQRNAARFAMVWNTVIQDKKSLNELTDEQKEDYKILFEFLEILKSMGQRALVTIDSLNTIRVEKTRFMTSYNPYRTRARSNFELQFPGSHVKFPIGEFMSDEERKLLLVNFEADLSNADKLEQIVLDFSEEKAKLYALVTMYSGVNKVVAAKNGKVEIQEIECNLSEAELLGVFEQKVEHYKQLS